MATAQRVRRFYKVESKAEALRSVSCSHRTTCAVAINGIVGDLGKLGDFFLGSYNRDYEAQLILDTTELFHRFFHDKKFQRGTITTWLEVQAQGGKRRNISALTVSCDRAANAQINWDHVGPEGLRLYCAYKLTPIRGLGG